MCGRFTQRFSWQQVHDYMNLIGEPVELRPRYNVAPGQDVAAVRAGEDGRRLSMLRWGLLPAWAKDPNMGYRMINARSETVAGKPAFRAAHRARRCLIPADGFFEWVRQGSVRQPYLVGLRNGRLMVFAGLWERWRVPENTALPRSLRNAAPGDVIETCAVLTTQANEAMQPIHHRMPVILPEKSFAPWLEGEDLPPDPYPADAISVRPVSRWVNNAAHDDPRCIEPADAVSAKQ